MSDTVKFSTTHQPNREYEGTVAEVTGLARQGYLATLEGRKVGKDPVAAVEKVGDKGTGQPTG